MTDQQAKTRAAEIKRCNKRMDKRAMNICGVLLACFLLYQLYTMVTS